MQLYIKKLFVFLTEDFFISFDGLLLYFGHYGKTGAIPHPQERKSRTNLQNSVA